MRKYLPLLIITILFSSCPVSEILSMSPADSLEAEKLYQKGDDFWRDVKYDSSNYYYEKASKLFEKGESWKSYIDCQKNMGINFRYLGNYNQAFSHLNSGLDAVDYLKENQDSLRAELYNSIGTIYYEKGNYDKAYKYYHDMLEINEKIFGTEHTNTGKGYHNVGLIYYRTGDYEKALEYFEKALSIWDSTLSNDNPYLANCYTNMSNVYFLKEEYSKSIEYDEKALKIWEEKLGESHPYVAMSYNNLASTYTYNGNFTRALGYAYKAMQIRRDYAGEESRDVAFSYSGIGNIFVKMGSSDNARYFLNKSIAIYRKIDPSNPGLSEAYSFSGDLSLKESEYKPAEAYYDSALYVIWPEYYPGDTDPGELGRMPAEEQLLTALIGKGNAYYREAKESGDIGVLDNALKAFNAASGVMEKLKAGFGREESKLILTKKSYEVNKNGVLIALKLYSLTKNTVYIESAFHFAERNKAGILSESIAESDARKYAGLPDSLVDKEKDLRSDVYLYQTKLQEAEESNDLKAEGDNRKLLFESQRKYDDLINYFEGNFPAYHKLKYPAQLSSSDEIRKLLPPNACLLEYFTSDSAVTIFVLTRGTVNAVTVQCDSLFFDKVKDFRISLQKLNYMKYLSAASDLYSKLVEPVEIFIRNKEKLYIIPDYTLSYLPFEALLTKNPPVPFNGEFTQLSYLINYYKISYHYSAGLLKESLLHVNNNPGMSFAGFAPVFSNDHSNTDNIASVVDTGFSARSLFVPGKKYSPLPETETEVESIGELFKEYNYHYDLFLNNASTESVLKSDKMYNYKFIHLATHSFIDEEHPGLSGLAFYTSPGSADDGVLHTGDIYDLNLNADLLVLSACESGLGKIVKGEGIYSLTRSFLYAGADNIVVSLWQVADKSTSALMVSFYKNILSGMDYSSALRKAKLDMIHSGQFAYPLEWSPFVLIGR